LIKEQNLKLNEDITRLEFTGDIHIVDAFNDNKFFHNLPDMVYYSHYSTFISEQ